MSSPVDSHAIEESELESVRTSDISHGNRGEQVLADADEVFRETEISPAATIVDGFDIDTGRFVFRTIRSGSDINVFKWYKWSQILSDCETRFIKKGNGDPIQIDDIQYMGLVLSRIRVLVGDGRDKCWLRSHSRLCATDLNHRWGNFVHVLKRKVPWDDKQYQSSRKWFLLSVERLMQCSGESHVVQFAPRPRAAPATNPVVTNQSGNRLERSRAWNEYLQTLNKSVSIEDREPIEPLEKNRVPSKKSGIRGRSL
jgi:hypothetical protein